MRLILSAAACFLASALLLPAQTPASSPGEQVVKSIFDEALSNGQAYAYLEDLVNRHPGRLAGSKSLEGAVEWGKTVLTELGVDRVYTQDVMVPHWERGEKESVHLLTPEGAKPLAALALGGSVATPAGGVTAEVIEVQSVEALATLGKEKIAGKIIFFNRPMDPTVALPGRAYGGAGDQRRLGPITAAGYGASAVLVRSLTHAIDDVPHTGNTSYQPDKKNIPAVALSTVAANALSEALKKNPTLQVKVAVHSKWFPEALSHNVIGEIRGSEFPDQIIVVGGHLDSWDIAPGAHDDGAGIAQAIEVIRLFKKLGLKPRHTLRCVLFTNEENGMRGATAYASAARTSGEKHIFAVESDNGGYQPRGFNLGSTQGNAHERAQKWVPLFEPYGLGTFIKGTGAADVGPLMVLGTTVSGLMPDSQRYFDIHHTAEDTMDKVNARELHLGSGGIAALIWLVDQQGL